MSSPLVKWERPVHMARLVRVLEIPAGSRHLSSPGVGVPIVWAPWLPPLVVVEGSCAHIFLYLPCVASGCTDSQSEDDGQRVNVPMVFLLPPLLAVP